MSVEKNFLYSCTLRMYQKIEDGKVTGYYVTAQRDDERIATSEMFTLRAACMNVVSGIIEHVRKERT